MECVVLIYVEIQQIKDVHGVAREVQKILV
jgi:hypothetical protein